MADWTAGNRSGVEFWLKEDYGLKMFVRSGKDKHYEYAIFEKEGKIQKTNWKDVLTLSQAQRQCEHKAIECYFKDGGEKVVKMSVHKKSEWAEPDWDDSWGEDNLPDLDYKAEPWVYTNEVIYERSES